MWRCCGCHLLLLLLLIVLPALLLLVSLLMIVINITLPQVKVMFLIPNKPRELRTEIQRMRHIVGTWLESYGADGMGWEKTKSNHRNVGKRDSFQCDAR